MMRECVVRWHWGRMCCCEYLAGVWVSVLLVFSE